MPYDEIIIGLSHKGVKGNPAFHSHILAEAFPDRECLSIRMDRWIPVSERLPETPVMVILADAETVNCGWFYKPVGWSWAASLDQCEPTHWMPLPEPPEVT